MEKRKIDMAKYADMHVLKNCVGEDTTTVVVRDRIPYAEKDAMARELVEMTTVIHDDSCVYISAEFDKIWLALIAKYYTDIDTSEADPTEIADFLINDKLIDDIVEFIEADLEYVMDIYCDLYDAFETTYIDDKCLTKALRTSFAFLFNGEDITESIAKAEAAKDTIFEAVSALRKVEKEREENIDNGTLKIGGNVINFAKK